MSNYEMSKCELNCGTLWIQVTSHLLSNTHAHTFKKYQYQSVHCIKRNQFTIKRKYGKELQINT